MFFNNLRKIVGIFVLPLFLCNAINSYAQSVSINTTGIPPVASTILDMSAVANKGVLLPNVALTSTADNTTITGAVTGLLIYNTATISDVVPGYYYWAGTVWTRFTTTSYNFENGLYTSGTNVRLGGNLTETTTLNFGAGFGNDMIFDLKDNSNFIIKNTALSSVMVTFANDGNTNYVGNLSSGQYYNFDGTFGTLGYGFREKAGDVEYKKIGGLWSPFPDAPPAGGTSYWWYKPALSTYIRPQNSDNVRIYDNGEIYGFYYNGSSNQYGGYFQTASATNPTSAVVGFSNVLGSQTYGYLGYNGTYNSGNGLVVDGAAVYGVVDDRSRAAVFGRTTRDANVSAIIGYSDVWISGYYYSKDVDATSAKHPALYGQLLVDVNKTGNQAAVKGYSEYTPATDNRGFTVGGDFIGIGGTQDASGVEAYAETAGVGTVAYGFYAQALKAETTYGLYVESGTAATTTSAYGVYGMALTATGIGTIGMGSNLAKTNLYSTGSGDGVVGGSDAGAGVFGYFYDGTGANSYGTLGYSSTSANYFYHNESNGNGNGQAAIKAIRTRGATASPGAAYTYGNANHAILGYNSVSDSYTFGVTGYSKATSLRTGGVFGKQYGFNIFGILGYYSSAGTDFGGYFNATTGLGTGKNSSNTASTGVGIGAYSNFLGSWTNGKVYGTITKGSRFAQYINGKTYTNNLIINLEENGNENRIPTYVPTSPSADIYLRGTAQLIDGKAQINFNNKYKDLISTEKQVIVTVTPIGETSGIHLIKIQSDGFSVAENNYGTGNIQFTWIAIAVRRGYENPENPQEVLSSDFDTKMTNFMSDETSTSKNTQPVWWDGTSIRYDAAPIKTNSNNSENEKRVVLKQESSKHNSLKKKKKDLKRNETTKK